MPQKRRRVTPGPGFRRALLVGCALSVLSLSFATQDAWAQETEDQADQLTIEADDANYQPDDQAYVAEGNVLISFRGRTVRADRVVYDQEAGEVLATGNVVFTDLSGIVVTTEEFRLSDDMRNGVIGAVQAVLSDDSQLAAAGGERTDGNRTVLSYAVYSPCEICEGEKPLWQIKARKVIHDQEDRTLRYRDAVMEVKGVPIFYLPYLEHPDPTVDRRTGFLTPGFSTDSELGVGVEIPFYWAPSRNRDFTIRPKYTSNEGLILFGEYRENAGFGGHTIEGSITNPYERDENNQRLANHQLRGHVFGEGRYDFGNKWRGGYDIAWASDDTYLRRYDISRADSLINNFFADRITDNTLLAIDAYTFQGLRQEDVQDRIPVILPMVEYQYHSNPGWMGGSWSGNASFLGLNRSVGTDMYRMSVGGSYELPYTNRLGQQFRLTVGARADAYAVNNREADGDDEIEGRAAPMVALDVSWPFARYTTHGQQIIEPVANIVATPDDSNPDLLPNEDSIDVQFSEINLFRHNRSPGLDIWESGVRATYGVRYRHFTNSGIQASLLVGQSWRLSGDSPFPENSGLDNDRSDIITAINLQIPGWLEVFHSLRLDEQDLSIEKNQLQVYAGPPTAQIRLGYLDAGAQGFDLTLPHREEVNLGGYVKLSEEWSANAALIQSFDSEVDTIEWEAGLVYESRCVRVEATLRRNYAEDRDIRPTTSVFFKVALTNLGM